jgi:hypothetical protein
MIHIYLITVTLNNNNNYLIKKPVAPTNAAPKPNYDNKKLIEDVKVKKFLLLILC